MTEARILCRTRTLRIGDLGLTMLRGEVVYLPLEQASKSKDLKVARQAQAVEVTNVQRARETRAPGTPPPVPRKPIKVPPPAAPVADMEADVSRAVQRAEAP